jgi:hypothetical protein
MRRSAMMALTIASCSAGAPWFTLFRSRVSCPAAVMARDLEEREYTIAAEHPIKLTLCSDPLLSSRTDRGALESKRSRKDTAT